MVKYEYTYQGGNENWTANLTGEGTWVFRDKGDFTDVKTDGFYKMTIAYLGDLEDLQALDQIVVGYDAGSLGGSSLQIAGEAVDDTVFVFERFTGIEAGADTSVVVTI